MTGAALAAVACAAVAGALWPQRSAGALLTERLGGSAATEVVGPPGGAPTRRPSGAPGASGAQGTAAPVGSVGSVGAVVPLVVVACVLGCFLWRGPVVAAVAVVVSGGWWWRRRAARLRQTEDERRAALAEAGGSLAALLRAGRHPVAALEAVAEEYPEGFAAAARTAQLGGDIRAVLERSASRPGVEGLRTLAVCWEVAETAGSPLAVLADAAARTLRDQDAVRRETAAQLASARTTARLLAALPVLPMLMAASLGADALGFLVGSGPGLLCLVAGATASLLGLLWVDRLARVDLPA